ncbi:MAG: rod shape-determining protein RodA [Magnetococcales bacterium]|nr:rod shape-determining protein RodA [Magnetococcales bacterium]MBF0155765.1 rod shape-determining protein RodA [Magnetococcales bacterium]
MIRTNWAAMLGIAGDDRLGLGERLRRYPWSLVALLLSIAILGLIILYSAVGGRENIDLFWGQGLRLVVGLLLLFAITLFVGEKLFRRYTYLFYGISLLLLLAVAMGGTVGMGARRWLVLGSFRFQPSELMKVGVILALARYFHDRGVTTQLGWKELWMPAILIMAPVGLIAKQPDLGTALLVAAVGGVVIFVAGLSWRGVVAGLVVLGASGPLVWSNLHDYQRRRVATLFSPEQDPLGSGYHIIQSKIAVGSGGVFGKGFLEGSQSHLDFLPERHTDFIFSVLAEEWGFLGTMLLILLYGLTILRGWIIASAAHDRFGILTASGLTALFGIQVVVNVGMVIGIFPVVGIPLPLVSYGGSSMMTVLLAMALLIHVDIHSKQHGRAV